MTSHPDTASAPVTYEVVVRGWLGPVLRAALARHPITALEPCLVVRVRDTSGGDLTDVLGVFETVHLCVEQVLRVPSLDESSTGDEATRLGTG